MHNSTTPPDYLAEAELAAGPYDDGGRSATPARIDRVLRREALQIAVSQQQAPKETARTTIARAQAYYEFLNG